MTTRIYYDDPYCTEFEARVEAVSTAGQRVLVILDRTAFYPTSGGQPTDTGTLDGLPVEDVAEREDGTITHRLADAPKFAAGSTVRGVVDWERRFDHMQQHTGQHILSAAFDRLHQARTVGFHLGADVSTLDLDRDLPPAAIAAAEQEANRVVWANDPVSIRFVSAEEAARLPLRKEPAREGTLRLIEVQGYDLSACGGTHVSRAGAVGIICVRAWERFRGGVRVEFLCGRRALDAYRVLRDAVAGSLRHLSVPPAELADAIERVQAENKAMRRSARQLQERLAAFEAKALVDRAPVADGRRRIVESLEGWDAAGLKALALAVASNPGCDVAVFSGAPSALVAVARSADGQADAGAVLRALTDRFGGKGGGRGEFAQGGGLTGDVREMLELARQRLGAR